MAKINFGGVVQDARGKQNGLVYSRNASGAYVRAKVSPVQPNTPAQLRVRAQFGANSKMWSGTLTQAQRNAWTSFAAANPITDVFGNSVTLNGLATFNRLNQILTNIGAAAELQPPVDLSVPTLAVGTGLTASHTAPVITITTASQSVVAGAEYYIFATSNQAPGVNPNQNQYRFIGTVASGSSTTLITITALWVAVFGSLLVGKNIWVLLATVNTATGAVTPAYKFSATVT